MKYYWINSDESIEEVDKKKYLSLALDNINTYGEHTEFSNNRKFDLFIGGDGKFEIHYFNKLVNKFLETWKIEKIG